MVDPGEDPQRKGEDLLPEWRRASAEAIHYAAVILQWTTAAGPRPSSRVKTQSVLFRSRPRPRPCVVKGRLHFLTQQPLCPSLGRLMTRIRTYDWRCSGGLLILSLLQRVLYHYRCVLLKEHEWNESNRTMNP